MGTKANDTIHIGFDLDGVLIDHTAGRLALAGKLGYRITASQTSSAQMRALLDLAHWRSIQYTLYQDETFALEAPLMEGAHTLLKGLQRVGICCSLISRRQTVDIAIRLLQRRNLWPEFFTDTNTFFVPTIAGKDVVCRQLGITHYLDDEARVLTELTSVPHRFLLDPHDTAPEGPWTRIATLAEFYNTIPIP